MATIQGIRIPMDAEQPIELVEFDQGDYRAIQRHIGGNFQCLDMERPDSTLFCDEEGRINGSEMNRRATLILWVHDSRFRGADVIFGNAMILGRPDDDGNTASVPDSFQEILIKATEWRYLVQADDSGTWAGNERRYDNWVDAYNGALALADRWVLVREVAVVPTDSHCQE